MLFLALEQPLGKHSPIHVGEPFGEDTIDETLKDGGHAGPPDRVDEYEQVRVGNDPTVPLGIRVDVQVAAQMVFIEAQDRIEVLLVQINHGYRVSGGVIFQPLHDGVQDGVVVSVVIGISVKHCDIHEPIV